MVKNWFFLELLQKYWHFNTTKRTKLIQRWILYACTKFGQNWLRNARQKSKTAAPKFSFYVILTSDRGDFPRIIVIALYCIYFFSNYLCVDNTSRKVDLMTLFLKLTTRYGRRIPSRMKEKSHKQKGPHHAHTTDACLSIRWVRSEVDCAN